MSFGYTKALQIFVKKLGGGGAVSGKEVWIDLLNKYIMEMKPDFIHAKYYTQFIEKSAYDKLQARVEELEKELENSKAKAL